MARQITAGAVVIGSHRLQSKPQLSAENCRHFVDEEAGESVANDVNLRSSASICGLYIMLAREERLTLTLEDL
jgi:hypothetical protein